MSSVKKDKEKNASKDMPDFVHLKKNFERRIPEKYFVRVKKKICASNCMACLDTCLLYIAWHSQRIVILPVIILLFANEEHNIAQLGF